MTMSKRTLLRTALGCSAALATRAGGAATPANLDACEMPSLGGELRCDAPALAAAADDFGHLVRRRPQAVFRPASPRDIGGLMRWAGSRGLKVVPRGQGHSIYGRAMAEGGVVLDMSTMSAIHHVEPDRIVVEAGATWRA